MVSTTAYNDTVAAGPIVNVVNNAGADTETQSDLLGRRAPPRIQDLDDLPYGSTGSGFNPDGTLKATSTAEDITTDSQYDYYWPPGDDDRL